MERGKQTSWMLSITANIQKESTFFLIEGTIEEGEATQDLLCYHERAQKKILKKNKVAYDKLSDHIGSVLAVMSTPYDTEIIRGASEVRRKWIDGCLSQFEPAYLTSLLHYQRHLKQRNSFLRSLDNRLSSSAASLLDTYDEQILRLSKQITEQRKTYLDQLNPYFQKSLKALVADHESCHITLKTQVLAADFEEHYHQNRQKDLLMQRTSVGSHKDDFLFIIENDPIKRFGSQGQQKSFLIALKLAQYHHLAEKTGRQPILLLDDVFDKLDDERIERLVRMLSTESESFPTGGQVFITDARKERTQALIKKLNDVHLIEIKEGNLARNEARK
jgi:DNA replication and repair protein RecF